MAEKGFANTRRANYQCTSTIPWITRLFWIMRRFYKWKGTLDPLYGGVVACETTLSFPFSPLWVGHHAYIPSRTQSIPNIKSIPLFSLSLCFSCCCDDNQGALVTGGGDVDDEGVDVLELEAPQQTQVFRPIYLTPRSQRATTSAHPNLLLSPCVL